MRQIKVIDECELEEKLLHTVDMISDDISNFLWDYEKLLKEKPKLKEKWLDRLVEFQNCFEKKVYTKIYKFLKEDDT